MSDLAEINDGVKKIVIGTNDEAVPQHHIDESNEEKYQRHSVYAAQVKLEYENKYRQMVDKLSVSQLEPLENTLRECEGFTLQKEPIIESLRQNVLSSLLAALNDFWDACDVETGLTSLEILKDRFKEFEGKDWKIFEKSPEERILPMRMYFKQIYKKHLCKQLKYQADILKGVVELNKKNRARIEEVSQRRRSLQYAMEKETEKFKGTIRSQLQEMQKEVLDGLENS